MSKTGYELLIVDAAPRDRDAMRRIFEEAGYVCTAVGTTGEARALVEKKFFPVAVVELDVESAGAGLELARFMRTSSRPTSVILLTRRRSFEAAIEALRIGCADVVLKQAEEIPRLRQAVQTGCDRTTGGGDGNDILLSEARTVLDDAFKIMLDMGRSVYGDVSVTAIAEFRPKILVVDSNAEFLRDVTAMLETRGWDIKAEMSGGGALDRVGSQEFHVVACHRDLLDFRGSMVVKTMQAQRAETIGAVYGPPGPEGTIDVYREGQVTETHRPFRRAIDLVDRIGMLVDTLSTTVRDRRVIQAFRTDHEAFFRRYGELRLRLNKLYE